MWFNSAEDVSQSTVHFLFKAASVVVECKQTICSGNSFTAMPCTTTGLQSQVSINEIQTSIFPSSNRIHVRHKLQTLSIWIWGGRGSLIWWKATKHARAFLCFLPLMNHLHASITSSDIRGTLWAHQMLALTNKLSKKRPNLEFREDIFLSGLLAFY